MNGMADLREVNERVNAIPYEFHVEELWRHMAAVLPRGACSNYAATKYVELVERGWPVEALRLACCYVEPFRKRDEVTGEWRDAHRHERYHAVLLVDFEGETLALDNRRPWPTPCKLLPYEFDLLQLAGTPDWERA